MFQESTLSSSSMIYQSVTDVWQFYYYIDKIGQYYMMYHRPIECNISVSNFGWANPTGRRSEPKCPACRYYLRSFRCEGAARVRGATTCALPGPPHRGRDQWSAKKQSPWKLLSIRIRKGDLIAGNP